MVTRRITDRYGRPIGRAHRNPMLDTRMYEVQYEDGTHEHLMANKIAKNLYAQVDDEGREILRFANVIDHRKGPTALTKENGFIKSRGCIKTTKGWEMLVEWEDGTSSWLPLRDIKEASSVELAEYAVAMELEGEPAFAWWVDYRKRDRIIKKAKSKYWRTTHKYGIRIPKTPKEALRINRDTGTYFWEKAMIEEMAKAKVSYELVDGCTPEQVQSGKVPALRGYQEISCHIIFDVKMDFMRKARFVANGSTTDTPSALTYSTDVSHDSVRMALLVAALNVHDIFAYDIGNVYLNAPCKEHIRSVAGHECGHEMKGKVTKLVRALYGLKSSGASWRKMFKDFIETHLELIPSRIDGDMYYKRNLKPNGTHFYELLLVYVADVLAISHDPEVIIKAIGERFGIKNDEYGPPTTYLGDKLQQFTVPNSDNEKAWSLLSTEYVKATVENVENMLKEEGRKFKTVGGDKHKKQNPLPSGYKPEIDTTEECEPEHHSRFQQLIGILRWAIELERADIHLEVALMSQYSANHRCNPVKRLLMDATTPPVDRKRFNETADWVEFYGDVVKEDPPGMPEPLGKPVEIFAFCNSDHASNIVTRRSHSGILLFAQNALICSFSKKQSTVEASTYGAELVAMRIARDMIVELRLKLKSIGIPMKGPANVYCDNQGVVKSTSIPKSTLSKKLNSINYHIVREAAAAGILRVAKEDTESNLADALTKLQTYGQKRALLGVLLYDY
ncbi:hypothetical protein ACHAWF_013200 [Thalassiosira exigua]